MGSDLLERRRRLRAPRRELIEVWSDCLSELEKLLTDSPVKVN